MGPESRGFSAASLDEQPTPKAWWFAPSTPKWRGHGKRRAHQDWVSRNPGVAPESGHRYQSDHNVMVAFSFEPIAAFSQSTKGTRSMAYVLLNNFTAQQGQRFSFALPSPAGRTASVVIVPREFLAVWDDYTYAPWGYVERRRTVLVGGLSLIASFDQREAIGNVFEWPGITGTYSFWFWFPVRSYLPTQLIFDVYYEYA